MTLNGVMAVFGVISATSVAFSAHCVKVVEDISYPNFLRQKYSPKLLVFRDITWRYSQWITPSQGVKVRNSPVVRCYSDRVTSNLTSLQPGRG